jgi:hypothetical protein
MFSVRVVIAWVLALGACGDDKKPPADSADDADVLPQGRTFLLAARAEAYDRTALRPWTASLASLTLTADGDGAPLPPPAERPVDAIVQPLDTKGIPWASFSGPDNRPT